MRDLIEFHMTHNLGIVYCTDVCLTHITIRSGTRYSAYLVYIYSKMRWGWVAQNGRGHKLGVEEFAKLWCVGLLHKKSRAG